MRFALAVFAAIAVVVVCTGCPNAFECGGLSTALPDVTQGKGFATRSDGATLNGNASWASGSLGSVDVAALDMGIAKDVTGSDLDTLVGDGAFPICIALAAPGTATQGANLLEQNSFKSDDGHTGNVALLKLDGDTLTGRFQVHLVSSDGSKTLDVTDGAFAATRR